MWNLKTSMEIIVINNSLTVSSRAPFFASLANSNTEQMKCWSVGPSACLPASQYSWLWLEFPIFEPPDLEADFLGSSTAWIFGSTPPSAIVTWDKSWLSSSSFRTASCKWRGMIRAFLLSRAAFPASSRTSAERYSSTAARYTGAPLPTRWAYCPAAERNNQLMSPY